MLPAGIGASKSGAPQRFRADTMRCEINDAASGDRDELTVTCGEFELREGFGDRFYEAGELLS